MRWVAGRDIGVVAMSNTTYAPMAIFTHRVLKMLNAAKLIPVARTSVAPVLQQRSEQLVALINQWDTDQAKKIFADNVHLDESFERRCDAARKMIAESGPALIQAIVATSNTEAVIFLTNSKKIEILIGPLHSGPIQWYEVK
jgi:hypothetical protein